jgi:hypothetical protein
MIPDKLQTELAEDVETIASYGRNEAPDEYAGVVHDRRERVNTALFAGDLAAHTRALNRRLLHPGRLRILPARFPLARLEEIQADLPDVLWEATVEDDGFKVDASEIDIEANVVALEVFSPDPGRLAEDMARKYGGALRLAILGDTPYRRTARLWDCYEADKDSSRLKVRFRASPRDGPVEVQVHEDANVVMIELLIDVSQVGDRLQPEISMSVEAALDEPLRGRRVMDATSRRHAPAVRGTSGVASGLVALHGRVPVALLRARCGGRSDRTRSRDTERHACGCRRLPGPLSPRSGSRSRFPARRPLSLASRARVPA